MAASTTYTTSTIVGQYLPSGQTKVDAGTFTRLISEGSRLIDTVLATRYIPFNSTTGTPPTPTAIQLICTRLVASQALRIDMMGARNATLEEMAVEHEKWAMERLKALRDEKESLPDETVATETLSWGTGGSYDVGTYECLLAVTSPVTSGDIFTLIPESVKILTTGWTQYGNGRDFHVRYEPYLRSWVLVDDTGGLKASGLAVTVTYDWSYQRYTDMRDSGKQAMTHTILEVP
jgi:hypothetical protein